MKKMLASALAVGMLVAGTCAAPARADTNVIFGTVGGLSLNYLPLFAAEELGYFKDEGITVQAIDFGGTATLLPQVATGRVTVGFVNAEPVILSHDIGKTPLPLRLFDNVMKRNIWEFSVLAASNIRTLADLKGKNIGIFGPTSGNLPITKAILANAGLHENDYTLVPVGLGAAAYLALQQGKIDALNLFDVSDDELNQLGTKVRIIPEPPQYAGLVSDGFIASNDMLRTDPDTLIKFGRAIAKAQVVCQINWAGCIRLQFRVHPETKPRGLDGDAAVAYVQAIGGRRRETMIEPRGHYGEYNPTMWRNFIEALHAGDMLSTTAIPVDLLFTNALVAKINAFNYDGAVRDAQKLK